MKRLHKAMTRIVGVLLMALMMVPSGLKAETTEMLQTSKITGVVTDDFGELIIGVTVRVKNAQNGAVTDVNGRYSVNAPKNAIAAPTISKTLSMENSCPTISSPSSPSLEAFVTRIPVASEMSSEGVWLDRPSPMVRMVYFANASLIVIPP